MSNAKVWEAIALNRGPQAVMEQLAATEPFPLIETQKEIIDKLAMVSLLEIGIDKPLMEAVLAGKIAEIIDEFITCLPQQKNDAIPTLDDLVEEWRMPSLGEYEEEKRLDDAERALAINRER